MKIVKWGIIGCGGIAEKFCASMKVVEGGEVVACASRTPGKAVKFGAKHGIDGVYDNYEELVARKDVDAVYVATTHNFHLENCLLALEAGKAVLCEKPMSVSGKETRVIVAKAREKGCFLMEAMWTRFLPAVCQVREWLAAGEIGTIKTLRADFCFQVSFDAESRLFNPDLAGGAVLDAGIYPISFASMVMGGAPDKVVSLADIGETGVDEQSAYLFQYKGGKLAILSSGITGASENRVEIVGTNGRIVIPSQFLGAQEVQLHRRNGEGVTLRLPFSWASGFRFEIEEVHAALAAGRLESEVMPLDESVALAETIDRIRAAW